MDKVGQRYIYNLSNQGEMQYYPLQMGNGEYTLFIYENITGNNYREISNIHITLNVVDDKSVFLNKIQEINWSDGDRTTQIADGLSDMGTSDLDKVKSIYEYVISNFRYDFSKLRNLRSDYIPNNQAMLTSQKGICYDFSALFASMLRSQGIPCKMIKGYARGASMYHAWNEAYIKELDKWVVMDLSSDSLSIEFGFSNKMFKNASDYSKSKEF